MAMPSVKYRHGIICEESLDSANDRAVLHKRIDQEMRELKQFLYDDGSTPVPDEEHLVSNEFRSFNGPNDEQETDLVIGYGTNSAWDLAVRKNAKAIVFTDWNSDPLKGQQFLMRPLILLSRSPNEFIAQFAGQALPGPILAAPLEEAIEYTVESSLHNRHLPDQAFIEQLLANAILDPRLGVMEFEVLKSYYRGYLESPKFTQNRPFESVGRTTLIEPFLQMRYNPAYLIELGADPKLIRRTYFSSMSSVPAFQRLQSIFESNVYYSRNSIMDRAAYEVIRELAARKGYTRITVSISNIFDCGSYNGLTSSHLKAFLKMMVEVFAADHSPVEVYRTVGFSNPSEFVRYSLSSPLDAERLNLSCQ